MRFLALNCCLAVALAGCAQQANKTPAPLSAAQVVKAGVDHQADINRILDLMSSPDQTVRVAGLQQALHDGDRNLRQLALSMAFAGSDPNLRNTALLGAIATTGSLSIRFTGSTTRNHYLADRIGDIFYVSISHPANSTAEFMTRTDYSQSRTDSSGKRLYMLQPGSVSASLIKFGLDLNGAGSSECMVALVLDPAGSALHGTLTCKNNESYVVASSAVN